MQNGIKVARTALWVKFEIQGKGTNLRERDTININIVYQARTASGPLSNRWIILFGHLVD